MQPARERENEARQATAAERCTAFRVKRHSPPRASRALRRTSGAGMHGASSPTGHRSAGAAAAGRNVAAGWHGGQIHSGRETA